MANNKFRVYFKQYMYYGIISMLVIVALVFLPMLDTSGKLGMGTPDSPLGWVAYIVIRCLVGVITFLIFISFDEQGKVNILDDERYKAAYNKLYSIRDKYYIPMSPTAYKAKTRGIKGITLSISMIATAFIVVETALTYNYSVLLAYGLTIFMSIISGIFQMNKASDYWTEEFPMWVDYYIEKIKERDGSNDRIQGERVQASTGTSREE